MRERGAISRLDQGSTALFSTASFTESRRRVPEHTYISDQMLAAVGRPLNRRVSFPVAESDIRKWAIAVYYPDPPPARFWDVAAAARSAYGGIVAPEEFNPFAWMAADPPGAAEEMLDTDVTERQLGVAGPGLSHQLNGGMTAHYGAAMRPGDVITSVRSLGGYRERDGRLGRMLFTTTVDEWTNQNGELVRQSEFIVVRY